jgi:menaquinone-dependent protoporphyrinogen oxidase
LHRVPSAFFSVSLAEADPTPKKRARVMRPIDRLLEETGWRPDRIASFAGSIDYQRHRWLMRLTWPRLPQPAGQSQSGDYEYTDWDAVERFAIAFVAETYALLAAPIPA